MNQIIKSAIEILNSTDFNQSIRETVNEGITEIQKELSKGNTSGALRSLHSLYGLIDDKEPMAIEFHNMKMEIEDLIAE